MASENITQVYVSPVTLNLYAGPAVPAANASAYISGLKASYTVAAHVRILNWGDLLSRVSATPAIVVDPCSLPADPTTVDTDFSLYTSLPLVAAIYPPFNDTVACINRVPLLTALVAYNGAVSGLIDALNAWQLSLITMTNGDSSTADSSPLFPAVLLIEQNSTWNGILNNMNASGADAAAVDNSSHLIRLKIPSGVDLLNPPHQTSAIPTPAQLASSQPPPEVAFAVSTSTEISAASSSGGLNSNYTWAISIPVLVLLLSLVVSFAISRFRSREARRDTEAMLDLLQRRRDAALAIVGDPRFAGSGGALVCLPKDLQKLGVWTFDGRDAVRDHSILLPEELTDEKDDGKNERPATTIVITTSESQPHSIQQPQPLQLQNQSRILQRQGRGSVIARLTTGFALNSHGASRSPPPRSPNAIAAPASPVQGGSYPAPALLMAAASSLNRRRSPSRVVTQLNTPSLNHSMSTMPAKELTLLRHSKSNESFTKNALNSLEVHAALVAEELSRRRATLKNSRSIRSLRSLAESARVKLKRTSSTRTHRTTSNPTANTTETTGEKIPTSAAGGGNNATCGVTMKRSNSTATTYSNTLSLRYLWDEAAKRIANADDDDDADDQLISAEIDDDDNNPPCDTVTLEANSTESDEPPACSICITSYSAQEKLRRLPCSHVFHLDCVDPWLTTTSATCPLCRSSVLSESTRERRERRRLRRLRRAMLIGDNIPQAQQNQPVPNGADPTAQRATGDGQLDHVWDALVRLGLADGTAVGIEH